MKSFVLDSTYKDTVIVNANSEFSTTPTHILPSNPINSYKINPLEISNNYISHSTKNDNLNQFNFIDYI